MQKNLKLVEENTLNTQNLNKRLTDVTAQLHNAEEALQRVAHEKEQAEARYQKEKSEAEMDFQAAMARLNEVHRNELEDVTSQLRPRRKENAHPSNIRLSRPRSIGKRSSTSNQPMHVRLKIIR